MIGIELAYCEADKQVCIALQVKKGCTAGEAIALAGLAEKGNIEDVEIGIYAKTCSRETVLKPGDRVELYRPLLLSPTEARRLRAATVSSK